MRKLVIIVSSLTLVVILLMSMGIPVMAAKPEEPNDNKPVAWVTSHVNWAGFTPTHPFHSVYAKLLTDGTVVGQVIGAIGHEVYSYDSGSGKFMEGRNYFWEWYDEAAGVTVKMADIKAYIYTEGWGPLISRYQIADYGEPGINDWHRVWVSLDGIAWWPVFNVDIRIQCFGGNHKINGNLSFTGPPPQDEWDPNEPLPPIVLIQK